MALDKPNGKSAAISDRDVARIAHGDILKTALTNPSEVLHLRRRLETTVTSSRDSTSPYDGAMAAINTLIYCDEFEDIATLKVSANPLT